MIDTLLDLLDLVPVVLTGRIVLGVAALLMLSTLWPLRRKRQGLACGLAVASLLLAAAAGIRLATYKELTPIQKCLAATLYHKQVAVRQIAGLVRQQYPNHQVVAVFPAGVSRQDPYSGMDCLAAALGPQARLTGVEVKPDKDSAKIMLDEAKRRQEYIEPAAVQRSLNDYFDYWHCGHNFLAAVASAGLSGDVVVVSFAGLPARGIEEIRTSGLPILVVSGPVPGAAEWVGDGTVKAVVLPREETLGETRCFHGQQKAFDRHWILMARETPGNQGRTAVPGKDSDRK